MITPKWFLSFKKLLKSFSLHQQNFKYLYGLYCFWIVVTYLQLIFIVVTPSGWLLTPALSNIFLVFMLCTFLLGSNVVLFFFTPSKTFFLFWESSKVFFQESIVLVEKNFFNLKIAFIFMMTIQIAVQLITFLESIKGYRNYQW